MTTYNGHRVVFGRGPRAAAHAITLGSRVRDSEGRYLSLCGLAWVAPIDGRYWADWMNVSLTLPLCGSCRRIAGLP